MLYQEVTISAACCPVVSAESSETRGGDQNEKQCEARTDGQP